MIFFDGLLDTDVPVLANQPELIYLTSVYEDTGWTLEDLPGAMDERDGWMDGESQGNSCGQHNLIMMKPLEMKPT